MRRANISKSSRGGRKHVILFRQRNGVQKRGLQGIQRICDFATGNAHTIVLIYAIVAVIVWVAVNLYFGKISFDLDREIREEMREYGDCYSDTDKAKFGKHITRLTGFIISIPAAVMWWCTPLIVAGLMIYDKIQEKNPELCGFKADDFDKEENK